MQRTSWSKRASKRWGGRALSEPIHRVLEMSLENLSDARSDSPMAQPQEKPSFAEEGRVALSVRLPRTMHVRMRELALRRGCRVNDLYQDLLRKYLEERLPGEPYLRAPPTSAQPVTLWLEPDFATRFRDALARRELAATNVVVSALLDQFGEVELGVHD